MSDPNIISSRYNGTLMIESTAIACHVLENGQRLFSTDEIQSAMEYDGKSENWLFEFMSHLDRLMPIDPDLLEELSVKNPFQYKHLDGSTMVKQGILPKNFLDSCAVILKAKNEGFLFVSELKFAKAAEIIVKNVDPAHVDKMIDFASGLELFKSNHKELLFRYMKMHLEKNYFVWIKTFPDNFFEVIFELKEWEWPDLNNNTAEVGDFLSDAVFSRIDEAVISILEDNKPRMKYRKKNSPQIYLENPQLAAHLQSILTLIKISEHEENLFTLLLNKAFPKKRNFTKLQMTSGSTAKLLSEFDQNLLKTVKNRKQ